MTTIAITGPTGTLGHGLIPLLQSDARVQRIVGIARRPFDPASEGWSKMEYREGDVRDRDALRRAFAGADAVAHLAFALAGTESRETLHAINVEGTLNAFRAAVDARVRTFVHASSVAVYGFHPDNPVGITEEQPIRGSGRMLYAREKAEIEERLRAAAAEHPEIALTVLRPTIVVGPHAAGASEQAIPAPLRPIARGMAGMLGDLPLRFFAVAPPQPLQFVHETDVGEALRLVLTRGTPPGTYNLTGDGTLSGEEVMRELGFTPLPVPGGVTRTAARALLQVPGRPAASDWSEALLHPLVVDAGKAKRELGWEPTYTSLEALRDALRG